MSFALLRRHQLFVTQLRKLLKFCTKFVTLVSNIGLWWHWPVTHHSVHSNTADDTAIDCLRSAVHQTPHWSFPRGSNFSARFSRSCHYHMRKIITRIITHVLKRKLLPPFTANFPLHRKFVNIAIKHGYWQNYETNARGLWNYVSVFIKNESNSVKLQVYDRHLVEHYHTAQAAVSHFKQKAYRIIKFPSSLPFP